MSKYKIEELTIDDIAKFTREELEESFDKDDISTIYNTTKETILKQQKFREIEQQNKEISNKKHPIWNKINDLTNTVIGIKAIKACSTGKDIKAYNTLLKNSGEIFNENLKKELNVKLQDFGEYKIETLKKTLGQFLSFLKEMEQKNKLKEYEILSEININIEEFNKTFDFTIKASDAIKGTIKSTGLAIAGGTIAPQLAMNGVLAWGTASTGTAISSLSGAAATNAALAALGGGPIAAGGGGMAAGAALLSTVGFATGGITLAVCTGCIASAHFSKKLTEAIEFENAVIEYITEIEKGWEAMDLIYKRIDELYNLMQNLEKRIYETFELFEPLVSDFNYKDIYQAKIFQKAGLLIKSISEIANAVLLNDEGNISNDTSKLIKKVNKIATEDLIGE